MTISPEYLAQQKELHKNPNYGVASLQYAPLVIQLFDQTGAKSVSDYGAGKCNLQKKMHELGTTEFEYYPHDPAFSEYGEPKQADLVCCIDVLEHVEPEHLNAVLDDLKRIIRKVGLFTIHTGPAVKTLSDGRNAHSVPATIPLQDSNCSVIAADSGAQYKISDDNVAKLSYPLTQACTLRAAVHCAVVPS